MSLTVTQAHDVNTLLEYVLGRPRPLHGLPTDDEAREAAERLADAANKRLMAGLRGADVTTAWSELPGRVDPEAAPR